MRACKVDGNHASVVAALVAAGASVQSLAAIGKGCPDLLVAYGSDGGLFLMEIKNREGKNKVNEAQLKWHREWKSPVHVVHDSLDALRVIGAAA